MKGNPYIKRILCEIAWCVVRMRKTYLSGWYWRVKQRRGGKKALIALARKILTIIYSILTTGQGFDETLYQRRQFENEQRRQNQMIRELQRQGFEVSKVGS